MARSLALFTRPDHCCGCMVLGQPWTGAQAAACAAVASASTQKRAIITFKERASRLCRLGACGASDGRFAGACSEPQTLQIAAACQTRHWHASGRTTPAWQHAPKRGHQRCSFACETRQSSAVSRLASAYRGLHVRTTPQPLRAAHRWACMTNGSSTWLALGQEVCVWGSGLVGNSGSQMVTDEALSAACCASAAIQADVCLRENFHTRFMHFSPRSTLRNGLDRLLYRPWTVRVALHSKLRKWSPQAPTNARERQPFD